MMDKKVGKHDPFFRREKLHQILLDFIRPFLFREIQTAGQSLYVRVHHDSIGFAVGDTEDNVCGLSRDPGQFQQIVHRVGYFAAVFVRDHPARRLDALGFIAEEAAGVDHGFQFFRSGVGELPGSPVFLEQCRSDGIDHLVRALSGQDRRNQQLKRVFVIQRAFCVRIGSLQSGIDLFGPEVLSLFWRRTWRCCLSCWSFRSRFCCRCLPCCHWMKSLSLKSFLWFLWFLLIR